MPNIRADTYKAVQNNDMNSVIFSDPFSDVTRKVKRNLLISSITCLLISVLSLKVTGFLGLQADNLSLGNELAQGIAFTITVYFFISFLFQIYIDYTAWNFKRERQETNPYYDLVHLVESRISVTGEQIENATHRLDNFPNPENFHVQAQTVDDLKSAKEQLAKIGADLKEFIEEVRPLIISWKNTISKMEKLSIRMKVRFVSLWALDIAVPLLLGVIALYKSYPNVPMLFERLAS